MRELYARQLRTDSVLLIIPATVIVAILLATISYIASWDVGSTAGFVVLAVNVIVPIIAGRFAWQQAQNDQLEKGGWVFIGTHLLLIAFNHVLAPSLNTYLPYLYGFFIVVSSTMLRPVESFRVWMLSTLLLCGTIYIRQEPRIFTAVLNLISPIALNLMLAAGSFITTLDWEMAVHTASESHVRAQRQRDEWYAAREELRLINIRQEFLYRQLETSMAVGQRITAILDIEKLLEQVAELIQKQLQFAYVGIFLLDNGRSYLELRTYSSANEDALPARNRGLSLDDHNAVSLAASHQHYHAIDDVAKGDYKGHIFMLRNVRSEAGFPLVVGGRLLGVLNIQSYAAETFNESNFSMLELLANQVAIAINNAQLYREQQIRYKLTATMNQIQRAISATIELDKVLDLILENLSTIVGYDRAAVFINRDNILDMVASRGFPKDVESLKIPLQEAQESDVFLKIYASQKPLAIPDVTLYPNWIDFENMPHTRAWLGVPLSIDGEVTGMLSLARNFTKPYNKDDIDLANTFAAQAAVALQNARLYSRLKRFNKDLEKQVEKRTQELSDALDRLTKLDRAKSDFIDVASHELRTPLTLLKGYSDMLRQDKGIQTNSYYQQIVSGIYTGSVRMHEVVNDMLDVVKIDNEELNIYPEQVYLTEPIKAVQRKLSEAIDERQQTLHVEGFDTMPPIEADPDALTKLFRHLVINAIKYTPDGGTIKIKAALYNEAVASHPRIPPDLVGVHITVTDTGIGIDRNQHDVIFTKFYQTGEVALHSSGKIKFKGGGPGLGLAIANGIVNAHHGAIWVESAGHDEKLMPGSCFHVVLPFSQTAEPAPAVTQS